MVVVDIASPADNWMYQSISEQLEDGEGILDWQYEVIDSNTPPLEPIEHYIA